MAASLLSVAVTFALRVAIGHAMQQYLPAFSLHGSTDEAVGVLIDMLIGVLVDTDNGHAGQQYVPAAFSHHGSTAAPALNRVLDEAVGVLIDTVIGGLFDTGIGHARQQYVPAFSLHGSTATPALNRALDEAVGVLIDLWAAFVVALADLVLVLFASCVVAVVVYLDCTQASGARERRLAPMSSVSLFLVTVAVLTVRSEDI